MFVQVCTVQHDTETTHEFDPEPKVTTLAFENLNAFINQNASKTYFDRNDRANEEQKKKQQEYKRHTKEVIVENNKISWFIDEQAYLELGEKALKMVGILNETEFFKRANYSIKTICERIEEIAISLPTHDDTNDCQTTTKEEQEHMVHDRKVEVLHGRLLAYFLQIYPQYEYELRFFSKTSHKNLPSVFSNAYLDSMVVHHRHYFPHMEPIGMAHQTCNIVTYTKGVPTPHIYVHNLTNFDSKFLLQMIPPGVMAYKSKNTKKQWSVIQPPGNKNKVKLLMTPFGTFSDSMKECFILLLK